MHKVSTFRVCIRHYRRSMKRQCSLRYQLHGCKRRCKRTSMQATHRCIGHALFVHQPPYLHCPSSRQESRLMGLRRSFKRFPMCLHCFVCVTSIWWLFRNAIAILKRFCLLWSKSITQNKVADRIFTVTEIFFRFVERTVLRLLYYNYLKQDLLLASLFNEDF